MFWAGYLKVIIKIDSANQLFILSPAGVPGLYLCVKKKDVWQDYLTCLLIFNP